MKLIVGLGNPGKEYEKTRHNVGFLVLDKLANKYNVSFENKKFNGKYCKIEISDEKVIFLKPQKYMNLSGEVIKNFVQYYKIKLEDLIIIHDDLDINIGDIKIKPKGSSGGHNGLKNIEVMLNTSEYKRVKIGILNANKFDAKDYVLGNFSSEEFELINKVVDKARDIILDSFDMTFENLMNKYN